MTVFLTELGKQLASRWATVVMLPGAVFAAAVGLAIIVGHERALDAGYLSAWVGGMTVTTGPGGAMFVAVCGLLLGATAAGLVATAIGQLMQWSWSLTGEAPVLRSLVASRRRRWEKASTVADREVGLLFADVDNSESRARARRAIMRRDAICLVQPNRPSWVADRLRATDIRVYRSYRLDLTLAWPRLWLIVPDAVRVELVAVQDRIAAVTRLAGWGSLYVVLALFWWPALIIGVAVLVVAWQGIRRSVAVYGDLVESAVDLYGCELARQLGMEGAHGLTQELGEVVTTTLRKEDGATLGEHRDFA